MERQKIGHLGRKFWLEASRLKTRSVRFEVVKICLKTKARIYPCRLIAAKARCRSDSTEAFDGKLSK